MELKSLDLKFQTRGILQPGKETVIAAIDEKSLDELGRWPWSRNIQARLVNKLTEYGARVIAFDTVFSEPDTNPGLAKIRDIKNSFQKDSEADQTLIKWLNLIEGESDTDQQFADSLRKSQRTILGYFFHFSDTGLEHLGEELLERSFENIQGTHYNAVRFTSENTISAYLQHAYAVESNISILSKAASGSGFLVLFPMMMAHFDAFHSLLVMKTTSFHPYRYRALNSI